ncbi:MULTISPECIES: hypothetical protein [Yersinia pseudotuberculosis complex]|nr:MULTISPECIES: hypothetical protein [Yersinia pseudotuberculosis complex]EIT45682.1 hypothetical protein YPPY99_0708 [Yersinia pestis PY-99]EIT50761.1 hypothetical protein YPPY101_0516 [Yersinia pestis PY-101]EIT60040.1 hypothetical protein YPPY102_0565 [Yersinia pestis PY-102]EIT62228.1 hypothetical protein YPPY103_0623 [Yersinia pestis PY-103]KFB60802.1 hypothetical protein EX92_12620 [Yersinia pestis subsp. pestis]
MLQLVMIRLWIIKDCTGASIAAGLTMRRLNPTSEIGQLETLATLPEKLAERAARAQIFSQNWPSGDLGAAVNKFAGSDLFITVTKSGKQIYTNPTTGVQVVRGFVRELFSPP